MTLHAALHKILTFLSLLVDILLNHRAPLSRFFVWLGVLLPGALRLEGSLLRYFQAVAIIASALESVVWVVGGENVKKVLDKLERMAFQKSTLLGESVRPLGVIAVFVVSYFAVGTEFVQAIETIAHLKEIIQLGEAGVTANERVRDDVEEMKRWFKARACKIVTVVRWASGGFWMARALFDIKGATRVVLQFSRARPWQSRAGGIASSGTDA